DPARRRQKRLTNAGLATTVLGSRLPTTRAVARNAPAPPRPSPGPVVRPPAWTDAACYPSPRVQIRPPCHGDLPSQGERVMTQPVTGQDDPAHFRRPSRRTFLHVGFLGGLGLTLEQFFRLQAAQANTPGAPKEGKAASVIHIFLPGGIAHQDSFDPKP